MKATLQILAIVLFSFSSLGQVLPTVAVNTSGDLQAPSKSVFLSKNVLGQQGIIRTVDTVVDLNAVGSPMRTGESVLVIDSGSFGNGGASLFTHDSGSSDPTNTVDTVAAATGRWKVRTVFSTPPAWSSVTGKPTTLAGFGITDGVTTNQFAAHSHAFSSITNKPDTLAGYGITNAVTDVQFSSHSHAFSSLTSKPDTLAGYGITNALPLTAGSNVPLTGTLYVPSIKLGSDIERTNWPSGGGGGIGGVTVNGSGAASNAVSSPLMTAVKTNGDFSYSPVSTTGSGTTLVLSDSPAFSGTVQFAGLAVGLLQATNVSALQTLTSSNMVVTNNLTVTGSVTATNVTASGTTTLGATTITGTASVTNLAVSGTSSFTTQTNTGAAGFGSTVMIGATNVTQKLAQLEDLMVFVIPMGSELSPTALTTNATTRYVPARKGVNWESTSDYNRGFVTIPIKCELVRAVWDLRNSVSASPSGSNIVWYARVNNTTDTAIHTNYVFDAAFYSTNSGAVSVSLNAGDTLAIKYVTPLWLSTSPQPSGPVTLYFKPRL